MTLQENIDKLYRISKLENDWNGYGAESFSENLIQICTDILRILDYQPEVYPTARDSIQFEWDNGKYYLEIEIWEDTIHLYEDTTEEVINECVIKKEDINDYVNKFYNKTYIS